MKQLYTAALLAALGLATVTTVHAGAGDVFLGFNDDSGSISTPTDYIIDLGYTASQLVTLANANNNSYSLSSTFSSASFNSAFGPTSGETDPLDNVAVGAVEANFSVSSARVLAMTVPAGNGNPAATPEADMNDALNSAASVTSGVKGASSSASYSYNVAQDPSDAGSNPSASDVTDVTGNNPSAYLVGGSITGQGNLELFAATQATGNNGSAYVDLGWFNITIAEPTSGTFTDTITFNTEEVPEPSTYALLGIGGLLAFAARRRFAPRIA